LVPRPICVPVNRAFAKTGILEGISMAVQDIAQTFTALCSQGKFEEACQAWWSDDIVSREPMPGDMAEIRGRAAVDAKGAWWYANHDVHSAQVLGP